ncbi:MAG: TraB/GumN family protein [Nitrospirae bacterium]|nr:TraB/GumN family protein [Nitrospirota bacterium]
MKRPFAKRLVLFIVILLLCLPIVQASAFGDQKSFLWKVRSRTTTIYILGSIHFSKRDIYPLNRKIEEAFERADILAVEADINNMGQMNVFDVLGNAMYPGEDTIERHISRDTYELLRKEAAGIGLPMELLIKQRPWFLALTLTSLELLKLGFDPSLGIDIHFLTKAQGRKKIVELESIDFQINLLSGFPERDQEIFLLYTLKDLNMLRKESDALLRAWSGGDVRAMESIALRNASEDRKMATVYEKLITGRNRTMTAKIEEYLKTRDAYFVVVGAGHLVGSTGIIEMLRSRGYSVEQM